MVPKRFVLIGLQMCKQVCRHIARDGKMKTYSAKPSEVERKWFVIDAEDVVLGRLAAEVAKILRGKHKPMFTPHIDCGDHVVILNAEKVQLTGNKLRDKRFYWHTGYPGGIKNRTMEQLINGNHPQRVIEKAVERMMPKGPMGRQMLKKLRVYAGSENPHAAQEPEVLDIAAMNPKNKRGA
jgi:large subunit ribosomal protein L13